jgi:hypothetical protein
MRFKLWLQSENLAGPGDGPDSAPLDQVKYYGDLAKKGAGAFPQVGNYPPKPIKTPTSKYLDQEHRLKMKKMKK